MPKKLENIVGQTFLSKEGYNVEITEYFSFTNCTIQFDDKVGTILKNKEYRNIKKGTIKNPYHPTVHSVGYLGVGKYCCSIDGKHTKSGRAWYGIFNRCLSEITQEYQPTYKDVTVCDEWHNFQNFAEWHEDNYNPKIMQDWQLDKDILIKGNKIYRPETCCFVPREINNLFTKNKLRRGSCPIGVFFDKGKFRAAISIDGRLTYFGSYITMQEAFKAAKAAKEKHIKEIADKWRGQITEPCYQAMYNYQVEITD